MTMLAPRMQHEATLPSLEDRSFVVLGEPTRSVAERVIEARSQFAFSLRCSFWMEFAETNYPSMFDEEVVRVVALDPLTVRLAAEYSSCAAKLEPTRLLEFEE